MMRTKVLMVMGNTFVDAVKEQDLADWVKFLSRVGGVVYPITDQWSVEVDVLTYQSHQDSKQ